MSHLNHERVVSHINEILKLNENLPLVLYNYVGVEYLEKLPKKEQKKYYKNRTDLMRTDDYNKFLEDELKQWLKKHPEFQDILIE